MDKKWQKQENTSVGKALNVSETREQELCVVTDKYIMLS